MSLNLRRVGGVGLASVPGSPARELSRLVQLQRDKLQALESRLLGCEAEMQDWDDSAGEANRVSETSRLPALLPSFHQEVCVCVCLKVSPFIIHQGGNLEEEVLLLEQLVRRNDKEMEEEEFWQNELLIEQESEQQLRLRLAELQSCVRDCEAKLEQYLARIEVGVASALAQGFRWVGFRASPRNLSSSMQRMEAGVEQEQLQQEAELSQEGNQEEVHACWQRRREFN